MTTTDPPKATASGLQNSTQAAHNGQSNKNAAQNGLQKSESKPAWTDLDDGEVPNKSISILETVIKAKLAGKPADSFDLLYEQTADQLYRVIYKSAANCHSIPEDYGHYHVLKRIFFDISGRQPKRFQEWCESVELRAPFWDLDIPEHPSHHYQAWMLKEHPTEAPDFEKRYKPENAAAPPLKTEPAKASSSTTEPKRAPIPRQTQTAPKSPKGKEKAVAPKPESTTTTNAMTMNPAKIDSCDGSSPFWVRNVIKNSIQDRQTHWQCGRLSNDLLAEGEGYFEVRLPHKLPTGQLHKECFNNQVMAGLEGFVHPDFKILRFRREGEWYLMPYRSVKKQDKQEPKKGKDSKEGYDARACSKVTSEFVATYFALRGLRQGIVPSEASKCEPVELFKNYFRNLAPYIAKFLLDAEYVSSLRHTSLYQGSAKELFPATYSSANSRVRRDVSSFVETSPQSSGEQLAELRYGAGLLSQKLLLLSQLLFEKLRLIQLLLE